MEIGHSEMIGLDPVYDIVTQLEENAIFHLHLNSQGYSDGLYLGGAGKYDIDYGVSINGIIITIASLLNTYGYKRWKGHDMQPRPYDNEEQAIDRVIRSVLSYEACSLAAKELNMKELGTLLAEREVAKAEDLMKEAILKAHSYFKELYRKNV